MDNNPIILTDSGDEHPGTSITAPLGLRNKSTVLAFPKPMFNDWAKYIHTRKK